MIKFIKLIFISFSVLLSFNNSISGTNFIEQVNKAYDKYVVVDDETIMVGDYTLVFGSYNNKYYVLCNKLLYKKIYISQQRFITQTMCKKKARISSSLLNLCNYK